MKSQVPVKLNHDPCVLEDLGIIVPFPVLFFGEMSETLADHSRCGLHV